MPKWLELYVVAIVHAGTIPAVVYPLAWRFKSPTWSHNRVGRALMRKAEALALLFVVSVANVWMPGVWWAWTYAAVVTFVVATLTWQCWVLLSVLYADRLAALRDRLAALRDRLTKGRADHGTH